MELTKEQKLLQTIVQRAWEDPAFKTALIADPINTIEDFTGKRLNVPQGKTLVVKDQTDESTIYINIPAQNTIDDMELTEEQLEIVAGGGDPGVIIQAAADPLNGIVEE